jgi:ABC-type transport system involved in cytochrome bd biosynthesis fused ATPase/permease subunit
VLIKDQSYCKLAAKNIFITKFPAIIAVVVYFMTAVVLTIASAVFGSICFGSLAVIVLFASITLPRKSKKN